MSEESDHDLLVTIAADVRQIRLAQTDHEERLRGVERRMTWVTTVGGLFTAGGLTAALKAIFGKD